MRNSHFSIATAISLNLALACASAVAQEPREGFEGWHLEPSVGQAHLVMVARVASISRVTVVEGAKTDIALREYRFQPVRRLKGIFQRDELSMTAADLGCTADGGPQAPPLKEGEYRLLILVQQPGLRAMGCVAAAPGASTFDERVPLLTGPDDPLVGVVETLIQVADARSRRERAKLLVDRLADVNGLSAVPLLSSLKLRADWAAGDDRAFASLARLARDPQPAVRGAALEVLRDMLAGRLMPGDPQQLVGVAESLRAVLESDEANTRIRLAALDALGHLLELKTDFDWPRKLLIEQLNAAATLAERTAAITALARIAHPDAIAAVLNALTALPLDEAKERESAYARAAIRLDSAGAERVLLARLKRSIAARQSLEGELAPLGQLKSHQSMPLLLTAAGRQNLAFDDRWYIAVAFGRLDDERAVPVLIDWLQGDNYHLKDISLSALEIMDTPMAAREVRALLKSEPNLAMKLRIGRLLARHGLVDGYALATEHLADAEHTPAAALALAALDDPRTSRELSAIVASRPDRTWHAAALAGLAAIGDPAARSQLFEILGDDRHPLAADAAEAAGLAADDKLLPPLATLAKSRNRQIALASLVALRRYLSGVRTSPRGLAAVEFATADRDDGEVLATVAAVPAETRATIANAVASLVTDAYVEHDVREAAFSVARLLEGEGYDKLLSDLADQAELEGTPLLAQAEAERRRLSGLTKQP